MHRAVVLAWKSFCYGSTQKRIPSARTESRSGAENHLPVSPKRFAPRSVRQLTCASVNLTQGSTFTKVGTICATRSPLFNPIGSRLTLHRHSVSPLLSSFAGGYSNQCANPLRTSGARGALRFFRTLRFRANAERRPLRRSRGNPERKTLLAFLIRRGWIPNAFSKKERVFFFRGSARWAGAAQIYMHLAHPPACNHPHRF